MSLEDNTIRLTREIAEDFIAGRSCDAGELWFLLKQERANPRFLDDAQWMRLVHLLPGSSDYSGILVSVRRQGGIVYR